MEIRWTTAFLDMAADTFDAGVAFWKQVTRSELSPWRGSDDEFATLLPATGHPYLRVQRTLDGSTGVHLDLHVDSVDTARDRAVSLGAEVLFDDGYATLASPHGMVFCFVPHHGEDQVPSATDKPAPHRLDQLSIDIPPAAFDKETAFWSELTGWALHASPLPEFRSLERPPRIPLRFLLQRMDDAAGRPAHAHLDIACGEHIEQVAEQHVRLGATAHGMTKRWMQMTDPGGMQYCLTPRSPQP